MAFKKRSARKRTSSAPRKVVVVQGTKRRRRRSAVGATKSRTKRRRRGVGATGGIKMGTITNIAMMAAGIAGGALATHYLLRPVENYVISKAPGAVKFIGAAEILVGGMIALRAKKSIVKAVGLGIMANGTATVMKQLNISKGISGIDDSGFDTIRIPVNGTEGIGDTIGGIIRDDRRMIHTPIVAGTFNPRTAVLDSTPMVAGLEDEMITPRGMFM